MTIEVKTHPGTLYNYSAGVYCGVLITERVMKKLAALRHEHMEQVKRVLADNAGEVFPSMWTLHYPDDKQTVVDFIDTRADVMDRIKAGTTPPPPRACFPVFIASSMDEAKAMADARVASQSVAPAETVP